LNIEKEQAEKLKRYFLNADPILWGVLEARNKKNRLKEIKALGFLADYSEGVNPTYDKINQDLLVELGIEGILGRIVVPQVLKRFDKEVLSALRRNWEQGRTPDKKYLKEIKLYQGRPWIGKDKWEGNRLAQPKDPAHIFVQINTQFDYVERWTVFAGLWLEEIEPLFSPMIEGLRESSNMDSGLKSAAAREI